MKRVLTAALLIPTVLYVALLAPQPVFLAVLLLVAGLCFHEYRGMTVRLGSPVPAVLGFGGGALLILVPQFWFAAVLLAIVFAGMALAMRSGDLGSALPSAAALALGEVYIFGGWRCAVLLRAFNPWWLAYALALNWIGDIAAYYVGRSIGRHKLAPRVSPAKSWEGAIASALASAAFGVAFLSIYRGDLSWPSAAALSVASNAAGQVGDLAESAIKRGAGVKDSGALLPGHGGMLDRVDSTLFALPVVYAFMLWRQ